MKGIVLCGGASTRMGTDKGLLKEEELTWAELAAGKLSALNLPVFVSVNKAQVPVYEQIFSRKQLIVDNASFDEKAPLFGLLSVHLRFPNDDLFALACDIRDMTTTLMKGLFNEHKEETYEAYVYHTGDRPQPLCGIYTISGLRNTYNLYQKGQLKRYSMMYILELLQTKYLPVEEEDLTAFNNYNSPDELNGKQ